jgi:alpha-galactosidase
VAITIAMVGAGSIGFTRRLVRDILAVPELADTQFRFTDISKRNLDMVSRLCRRDIAANGLPAKVISTTDRRRAIAGADYIICTIRQGGLEAFKLDIDIPLGYGIDQCVGDTLCAGGIMYGQRTIPAMLEFCSDIRQLARPGALLLNYSNPMAMNTWACTRHGQVNTVGLCHGVQGAQWQIARALQQWARKQGMIRPGQKIHRRDIDFVFAGINHQTWCIRAAWRGVDLLPMLLDLLGAVDEFRRTEKCRLDVLGRFGYYCTESNGHLSEYLPWYRKRAGQIMKWIDVGQDWIHGETGGYLRYCTEGRNWFETDFPRWMRQPPPRITARDRSEEHGSYIIEALETGRVYRGHFNVVNRGIITNLPDGCIVEVPGYADRNGISIPVVGDLPLACAATCAASVRVQEMSVEAAVRGDVTLLKQAMLHDPLTAAVCDPEEIWQLADDMLIAQARWLPQYRSHIPAARRRLAEARGNGTRVKLLQTEGVARLRARTAAELAAGRCQADVDAAVADGGGRGRVVKPASGNGRGGGRPQAHRRPQG